MSKEYCSDGTIVVKIGGSTIGEHDTAIQDIASLCARGLKPVVVHGGGSTISEWMAKQNVRSGFAGDGRRVTDENGLPIVIAVLAGLVNKHLSTQLSDQLSSINAGALGMSGADGKMLIGHVRDPKLGFVGDIVSVNTAPILAASNAGFVPVIAPIAVCSNNDETHPGSMLNVNADSAAGEIARALSADALVLLTDVEGVLDRRGRLIQRITQTQVGGLIRGNIVREGMIPKVEACLVAASGGCTAHIIDGRDPNALSGLLLEGKNLGTRIV